jgi:glycosyltransferase involved in cell wall biosynthesis
MTALGSSLKRRRVQLAHIFFNDAAILAPFFLKMYGVKIVTSRRDMGFWYTPLHLRLLKISNYCVDVAVANSYAVREHVSQKEHLNKEKIEVIYNGHDLLRLKSIAPLPGFRAALHIENDAPIIGMVANLRPIKRFEDAIQAFALVVQHYANAHFVIVGEGEALKKKLTQLAASLHVADKVHFLGGIADPVSVVKHFSVGLLCSETEGLSNAIIEYMACGKPIVCTNVGGNPELVKEDWNGFLIKVGDIIAIVARIEKLLSNQPLSCLFGARSQTRVAERFTIRQMVEEHEALYERLAGGNVASEKSVQYELPA